MKCAICKGILKPIKDKKLININGQDILISNIEMLECQNCGERYLTPKVDEKIEALIQQYKEGKLPVIHHEIVQLEV